MPLLLKDGQHVDRSAIDTCKRHATNFWNIILGPNEQGYHCIRDGIYASMRQVSKEKLIEDKEAARQASQC